MAEKLLPDEIQTYLRDIPEEVLEKISFAVPWQYYSDSRPATDADGFSLATTKEVDANREALQKECWNKFHENPQVNTAIRGLQGRLTGFGFDIFSEIPEIQDVLDEIIYDKRNRLYHFLPKYVGRTFIEGELFLSLTLHKDGFVEVDFVGPEVIANGGDDGSGIIYHPTKPSFPLYFNVGTETNKYDQVPSVNLAFYPELRNVSGLNDFSLSFQKSSKSAVPIFKQFGGFRRFILYWDRGFLTKRSISYLRTVLEWLNHYENLKKYEIDHKKSAGAYLWTFSIEDARSFKLWMSLTDEEKKKTGIMAPKVPGGSLVLPPGMKLEVHNPKLNTISNQDTDILEMVGSGLNEPSDIMTGSAKGTFASVKASRGPMSDRVSDEVAFFDRFLKHDFWSAIFFFKSRLTSFPKTFPVRRAVGWKKVGEEKEPIFKEVQVLPEFLIDIDFPISETLDLEARAKGLLGTKHGPLNASLGIPNKTIAKKIGISGYGTARLRKAEEDDKYPPLQVETDALAAESRQEIIEGEKPKSGVNKLKKKGGNSDSSDK